MDGRESGRGGRVGGRKRGREKRRERGRVKRRERGRMGVRVKHVSSKHKISTWF